MALIECVFAYVLPRESSSSSIVERMLAIARLPNTEIVTMGSIGLPLTEKM